MVQYLNLAKNENDNRLLFSWIGGIYAGSVIGLIIVLVQQIVPKFERGLMPIKEIAIFLILSILSIQSLLFFKKLIIKIKDNTNLGDTISIILSIGLLCLVVISIFLPEFTFIGLGMLLIFVKARQLHFLVRNENVGEVTQKYFERIYGYYAFISILTFIFALAVDFNFIPFLPIISDTPDYTHVLNQLSTLSNSGNNIESIKNVLVNLHSELQTIQNSINIALASGIIISFLLITYITYKFVLIRKINLDTVYKELDDHFDSNKSNGAKRTTNSIGSKLIAFLTIIRPFVSSIAGSIASVIYYQTTNNFQFNIGILVFFVVFLTAAYGFVLNDYFDIEKDKIDHINRPLPSGNLSPKIALFISILFALTSLLCSAFIGVEGLIINIGTISLLGIYSKINNKKGIWANLITATISSFVLIIGMSAGTFSWVIFSLSFATFFLILGREIILDIRDVNSDKAIGKDSFPIKIGIKKSVNLVIALTAITSFLLIFSSILTNNLGFFIILGIITNIMLWFSIIDYRKSYDAVKLERYLLITRIAFMLIIPALFFI